MKFKSDKKQIDTPYEKVPKITDEKTNIHPCDSQICKGGNCPGCSEGKLYCSDIRCSPYCPGCKIDKDNNYNNIICILCIIICLLILGFIIYMFFAPKMMYNPN